jgi:hypothetical protein
VRLAGDETGNVDGGKYDGDFAIWSKMVRLDPTVMVSTEPKRRPTSMRVSRGGSGFGLSRDQIFNKLR